MEDTDTVSFNCTIDEPLGHVEEEDPPPPSPPPRKKPSCCPVLSTPVPAMHSDLDALPIILVGIGVAYAIGVATGVMFASPVV